MGQKLGKCRIRPEAERFARLPKRAIDLVWREIDIIAEGFALKQDEFIEICACLAREMDVNEHQMEEISTKLFNVLDTDQNDLVDALEFFGAIAALSGMRHREIFEAMMSAYDFDGTKYLSLDEVILALKCVTTGLAKVSFEIPPREVELEELVSPVFAKAAGKSGEGDSVLFVTERISIILDFLMSNADIHSWFVFFSVPGLINDNPDPKDFHKGTKRRSNEELSAVQWNLTDRYVYESKDADQSSEPWRAAAPNLEPLDEANRTFVTKAPDATLKMEWIYGYESAKTRNTVHYLFQGDVIYSVGRYVVMYSLINESQRIFSSHMDDVVCLAVHPDGKIVASVDSEDNSRLIVWNSEDMSILYTDRIRESHGASDAAFSADGKLVCVVGTDIYHTVSVYNWATKQEILCAPVSRKPVRCCGFTNEHGLVVGGGQFLYFWEKSAEGHALRKGIVLPRHTNEVFTSVCRIGSGNSILAGTGSGHLLLMTDINCVKAIEKAHTAAITGLFWSRHGILSAGDDAKIRMWSQRLVPGVIVDSSIFAPLPAIRSVCMSVDGSTILFGTLGSCICEVSALDGANIHVGPIVTSHYKGSINTVAVHPELNMMLTGGDDGVVRLWDMEKHTLSNWTDTGTVVTSACFGLTADSEVIIAVGFGGIADKGKCGAFAIYDQKFRLQHEAMDTTNAITAMKFSPEYEMLSVGFHDGAIFLYAVTDDYELIGRCAKHELPVTRIDYSSSGEYIRSNSLQKDIAFFNADDASLMDNYSSMRDLGFHSHDCLYSWHSKSIHRSQHLGEEVTAACIPGSTSSIIASATNCGYVRLHTFPCVHDDAEFHRYSAHSSAVSGMAFTADKKSLVTSGLHDRCIIQWKVKEFKDLKAEEREEEEPAETDDYAFEARDGHQLQPDFIPEETVSPCSLLQAKARPKPKAGSWRDKIIAPTRPGNHMKGVPEASLHLDHVYGFNTQGMRNNVVYNCNGDLVYPCSRIGVVQKRVAGSQVFFDRHSDRISAFALSRDGKYAATGQHGHKSIVAVWCAVSGETLQILPDLQQNGSSAITFSKSSSIIAVAGLDDDHSISVYDWRQGILLSRGNGGGHHIFQLAFSLDGTELLQCGIKDLKIWDVGAFAASYTRPTYGEFTPPHPEGEELDERGEEKEPLPAQPVGYAQPFLSCTYFTGRPIVGTADGHLYVYTNKVLMEKVFAHPNGVTVMSSSDANEKLITGGPDGLVVVRNTNLEKVAAYPVAAYVLSNNLGVISAFLHPKDGKILVGIRGAAAFEIDMTTSPNFNEAVEGDDEHEEKEITSFVADTTVLVKGHHSRETWGLDVHPSDDLFITSGDDGMLHVWDVRHRDVQKSINVEVPSRCVTYSPNGEMIAIGFGSDAKKSEKDGAFIVIATHGYKIIHEGKDSSEPIRSVRFSPNSTVLAVASEDTRIYIYNVEDAFSKRATVDMHRAPVMEMDFSTDGQFIYSTDSTNCALYCDASTGESISKVDSMRDETWATVSSIATWSTQGSWLIQPTGLEPSCVSISHDEKYLMIGNNGGRLQLVNFPCPAGCGFSDQVGHSGHIAKVKWLAGDTTVLSIGARDNVIMQWRIGYDDEVDPASSGAAVQDAQIARDCGEEIRAPQKNKNTSKGKGTADDATVTSWVSSVEKPSRMAEQSNRLPDIDAELHHVSGCRLSDARNTLKYNENGHIVYIAGNTCVIYSRDDQMQFTYIGHKNPIVCLDIDVHGRYAASGDYGPTAELHIWDARTGRGLTQFVSMHKTACVSTAFSKDGHHLVSMGKEAIQSILVYNSPSGRWWDAYIVCSFQVASTKCLWVKYIHGNEFPVVVGGEKCLYFFRQSGRSMERKRGVFGKDQQRQAMLCLVEGDSAKGGEGERSLLMGCLSGDIMKWYDRRLVSKTKVHGSAIYSIAKLRNGHGYITASKDGEIKMLSNNLSQTASFNTRSFRPQPGLPACHGVECNQTCSKVLVGARGGEIYEISVATGSSMNLVETHFLGEVHGLATNPVNPDEYVTVGDDGMVCIWNISTHVCLRKASLDSPARAVAWSPDGTRLAVGLGDGSSKSTKDGAFMMLDADTLDILFEDRKSKMMVSDVKFSPNGERMGFGTYDGSVYIHNAENFQMTKRAVLPTKGSHVHRFDFSSNTEVIRVASDKEELDFFKVGSGEQITEISIVRDTTWSSHDCPYAYQTRGVWKLSQQNAAKVLSIDVNEANGVVVACYDDGRVTMFRYPCLDDEAEGVELHSSCFGAVRAKFTSDDKYLLVLEPKLRSVFLYRVLFS